MAASMTIATAVRRIGNLTPTYRSPNLVGDGAYVCTPSVRLPEPLREAQWERTTYYMRTRDKTARIKPDHAPRYFVTSYGVLIAWVTLDGTVHYAPDWELVSYPNGDPISAARFRAIRRHQDAVRAVWPERFSAVQA